MASVPPPDPPAESVRGLRWDRIFRLTAELSALFSFVAFAASCVINSLVFARWRHDFLQLATPSDVVMSGTRLAGEIGGPLLVALPLAAFALVAIMSSDDIEKVLKRLPGGERYASGVSMLAMMLLLALWGLGFVYVYVGVLRGDLFLPDTVDLGLGVFLLLVSSVMIWELVTDGNTGLDPGCATYGYWTYVLASLPAALLLCGSWFDQRIERLAASGFHGQRLAVLDTGNDVCGGGSRLLWSGSQAELVECPRRTPSSGRLILVMRNAENLRYQPADAAASAASARLRGP